MPDADNHKIVSTEIYAALAAYLEKHYIKPSRYFSLYARKSKKLEEPAAKEMDSLDADDLRGFACCELPYKKTTDAWPEFFPKDDKESFSEKLFRIIDKKGLQDTDVYKSAQLDRKLFSKLRRRDYHPSKKTVISLALALQLNADEAADLLLYAGCVLAPNSKFDLIVRYCLEQQIYDVFQVNELLYHYTNTTL